MRASYSGKPSSAAIVGEGGCVRDGFSGVRRGLRGWLSGGQRAWGTNGWGRERRGGGVEKEMETFCLPIVVSCWILFFFLPGALSEVLKWGRRQSRPRVPKWQGNRSRRRRLDIGKSLFSTPLRPLFSHTFHLAALSLFSPPIAPSLLRIHGVFPVAAGV